VLNRSLYIFGSKMMGYGIRILLPIFLVRVLSKADYGAYGQFFMVEVFIASAFQLGINQSLYYFIPRDEENAGAYFLNSLLMNCLSYTVAFVIMLLFRGQIADAFNLVVLRDHFAELSLYTVGIMLVSASDCYLCARQRIKQSALFDIGGQVLVSVVTLVAAFVTRALGPVIMALVVARLVQLLVMLGYVHLRLRGFHFRRLFLNIGEQFRYGAVLGLGGAAWVWMLRVHELIVSRNLGVENYAVYKAGITELPVVQYYLMSLAAVALGRFAVMEKERDWEGIRALYREILAGMVGIVIPFIVVLVLVAKPLVITMFTENYAGAVPIFRINTLAKLAMLWNAQLVLRAMGRNDVTLWVYSAQLVIAPFLLTACFHLGGMIGVIAGHAGQQIAGRLICQVLLNRLVGLPMPFFVGPGAVLGFYRDSFFKVRAKVRSLVAGAEGRA